jgi:Fe-S cluster biogenesis protein NfuA
MGRRATLICMGSDDQPTRPLEELATLVRDVLTPLVAVDKGQIEWVGVSGSVAEIQLGGACAGCPGQSYTVNKVILPALRVIDPSIESVRVKLMV